MEWVRGNWAGTMLLCFEIAKIFNPHIYFLKQDMKVHALTLMANTHTQRAPLLLPGPLSILTFLFCWPLNPRPYHCLLLTKANILNGLHQRIAFNYFCGHFIGGWKGLVRVEETGGSVSFKLQCAQDKHLIRYSNV